MDLSHRTVRAELLKHLRSSVVVRYHLDLRGRAADYFYADILCASAAEESKPPELLRVQAEFMLREAIDNMCHEPLFESSISLDGSGRDPLDAIIGEWRAGHKRGIPRGEGLWCSGKQFVGLTVTRSETADERCVQSTERYNQRFMLFTGILLGMMFQYQRMYDKRESSLAWAGRRLEFTGPRLVQKRFSAFVSHSHNQLFKFL